jgi:nitroimidazol reductase NimA-like FMN-containing flavoprotein (pyridoxamine 5'-phosphate oxidase superfamily)
VTTTTSTARTAVRRHRERGRYDAEAVHAVLDAALVCHLGVSTAHGPLVLPTVHGRVGSRVYVHGSTAAASLRDADAAPVCLTASIVDGIVLARSAFEHSLNYRSVVVLGTARAVTDPAEVLVGLRAVTEHVAPGRWDELRPPTRRELAATRVLALDLEGASVKIRSGPPGDAEGPDAAAPVWAGVLPVRTVVGDPEPDAATLAAGIGPGRLHRLAGSALEDRRAALAG